MIVTIRIINILIPTYLVLNWFCSTLVYFIKDKMLNERRLSFGFASYQSLILICFISWSKTLNYLF